MSPLIPNRSLVFKILTANNLDILVLPGTTLHVWIVTDIMGRNGLCVEIPSLDALEIPLTLYDFGERTRMLVGLNMVPAVLHNLGEGMAVLSYYHDLPNGDRHTCSFGLFDNRPFLDPA